MPIPPVDDVGLRGEFREVHLLTFMVISRCCSPVVQLVLRSCRERLDAGHQAWHFILSTYQVRDDLYIAQLEEKMTHIRMAEHESTSKKTSSTKDVDNSSGKSRGNGEASCSMVGVAESTVSLASEAGEDFQAVVATMQANSMAVLLDSGCSHHLVGTKAVFVNMAPSDGVKHVRGFNGALQSVEGRRTIALQGEAGKRVLIPDMLYVPGVQANLLSASQLKESGVVATGLDITPSIGADPPCVSCVEGKVARHTFPDKGSDAEEALAVVHIDLCGPFRVAAKDGSFYFLLLKDRHTQFVWVMLVAKKSDVLREFHKWLVLVERQQNGMAEREMCTAVESVRTMLLHMGVQHHWWHLTLRQAVWVRNSLERLTTPLGTTPYQLLTGKKPDLTLARVWGCMVQFMVPEQQHSGKLASKARWGLHLGVSPESKGWEVLDLTDNKVVTSFEVIFYETMSLEVWRAKFGPASRRTLAHPPTDTLTATVPLLAEVDERADEDLVAVLPPSPVLAPLFPVADQLASTSMSATGDEGSLEASPVAPATGIASGRQGAKLVDQDGKLSTTGEQQTGEPVEQEVAAGVQLTRELPRSAGGEQLVEGLKQLVDDLAVNEEGELLAREESTDNDVVEVPITKPELRRTGQA
ncbi:unnamed protein product [Closterium sp. NIES-54]